MSHLEKLFAHRMIKLDLPTFRGHGVYTSKERYSIPKYAGRFFLANMLIGRQVNKQKVFSNGAF